MIYRPIPADGDPHVEVYNSELARLTENRKNTWFTAPWLFAEYVSMAVMLEP
jgi:hypothetical protein